VSPEGTDDIVASETIGGSETTDPSTDTPIIDPLPVSDAETFYVAGRHLHEPCGTRVLLRGVNKMNIWTDRDGLPSFTEIAKTGANTVRITWDTTGDPDGLETLLQNAWAHDLLPMIELHDATGDFSQLSSLVDYWVRQDVVAVITAYRRALLVNIGNEVGNWNVTGSEYRAGYTDAITRMRQAGIDVPLVIDSRGWAHDVDFVIDNGPALISADPLSNIMFSTHLYYPDTDTGFYDDTLKAAVDADLPLLIGEFGDVAWDCSSPVDYAALIAAANTHDIGWYAWSWGPGNNPCASLDMSDDNTYEGLHAWGYEVAVSSPHSIRSTSLPIANLGTSCPQP